MQIERTVLAAICLSTFYVLPAAAEDGYMQKGDNGSGVENSQLIYEEYDSRFGEWRLGVGTLTIDAGFHVGPTARFDQAVRIGLYSPLAMLTVGAGYGASEMPIVLKGLRLEGVTTNGNPAFVFEDRATDSTASTVLVSKRGGNGVAMYVQRDAGDETSLLVETTNNASGGGSALIHHRGDGIALSVHNNYGSCMNSSSEWIECLEGGVLSSDVVDSPAGKLVELVDAGVNRTVDIHKAGPGTAILVTKDDLADDHSTVVALDNHSNTAGFISAMDRSQTTTVEYLTFSKDSFRLGNGVKLGVSTEIQPGEPEEMLHVDGGNAKIEDGDLQVANGYVQLDLSSDSAPPADDCSSGHEGRMKYDNVNDRLYICDGCNWNIH